jgi:acyl-CoA thioester hydrolase
MGAESSTPDTRLTDAGTPIDFDIPDPFFYELIVAANEVDTQHHVNNAAYVRWMDHAAYAHSCDVGYDMEKFKQLGATFVVRRHEIDYLAEGFEDDRIIVATWPGKMKRFSADRYYQVVRQSDGVTLLRALTVWVFINIETGRPQRMPDEMITAFRPRGF